MILETLDTKKDDIFIYSENKFDLKDNFKIIKKNITPKYPSLIHFNDVCKYIEDDSPKSLVVYRLLSNLHSFEIQYLKYGYVILINGKEEIIHFDPIFAIKELEEYSLKDKFQNIRFRIQQVGLISQLKIFGRNNFSEVYAFDLEAEEAQVQNDKFFAEIIFAFDDIYFDTEKTDIKGGTVNLPKNNKLIQLRSIEIEEDLNYKTEQTNNLTVLNQKNFIKEDSILNQKKEKKESDSEQKQESDSEQKQDNISNQNFVRRKTSFGEFLTKIKTVSQSNLSKANPLEKPNNSPTKLTNDEIKKEGLLELFKNSSPIQSYFEERGKHQIILKYKHK